MIFRYDSELSPFGPDKMDFDWEEAHVLSLPTDQLTSVLKEYEQELQEHRASEPSKKRNNKDTYRVWIATTHDLIDRIKIIKEELDSREK